MNAAASPIQAENRQKVLFLCTANYYRSRFAEMLFNQLARRQQLRWQADSRALDVELGLRENVGPISPHVGYVLKELGLEYPEPPRAPKQVSEEDLRTAQLVIAMREAEHRPLLQRLLPEWVSQVEYWHVHDVEDLRPEEALMIIAREVRTLLQRLASA